MGKPKLPGGEWVALLDATAFTQPDTGLDFEASDTGTKLTALDGGLDFEVTDCGTGWIALDGGLDWKAEE